MTLLALLAGAARAQPMAAPDPGAAPNQVAGMIRGVYGSMLLLETRRHTLMRIDAAPAIAAHMNTLLRTGRLVIVEGVLDSQGVMHARMIDGAKRAIDPSIRDY